MRKDFDSNAKVDLVSGPQAADIAIIGLAGRYPQAEDLDQLWDNLKQGRDCVTEVPGGRWDHGAIYDPAKGVSGKTYSKWGGFLQGVDEFDPRFFNISPREAEIMDPQERLFLQCAYHLIEDAGYTRQSLSAKGRVGVYVGVQYTEYTAFSTPQTLVAALPASIANRVSFFCDWRGPSLTLDSMCSSSLTTLHLACQSLRCGESDYAVAGGVNVSIHPDKYLLHAQGRFASSVGCCKTFGQGGDGYVPAEGVGAVLLKPLARAVADGDRIYAVIKGTAINHGGRATGFTVPKSSAQASVVASALEQAGFAASELSYIEAHGTGTALGDLIEVEGLRSVFQQEGFTPQSCVIGSIKSNIGHCESAAGIAGLTKVLLQLKHGQLVPSLHSAQLNRNIDFATSPFQVQQDLAPWTSREGAPRRAGVSSFGAGGSNAHVVLEEYRAPERAPVASAELPANALILLSARSRERLQAVAAGLLASLERDGSTLARDLEGLHDLAYTLLVGREALDWRVAFLAGSADELKKKLRAVAAGVEQEGLFHGQALKPARPRAGETPVAVPTPDPHDSLALIRYWLAGGALDGALLYGPDGFQPARVGLPFYPFVRERCWVPPLEGTGGSALLRWGTTPPVAGHRPLLRRIDDGKGHQFVTTLRGDEFFLDHHRVNGRKILPGVAYLEMALEALKEVSGQAALALGNILWIRPFECFDEPVELSLSVQRGRKSEWEFEFFGCRVRVAGAEPSRVVYCRGQAERSREPTVAPLPDLDELSSISQEDTSVDAFYQRFAAVGIDYGPGHRGLRGLRCSPGQVLARLQLPEFLLPGGEFRLHPSLLDSALQAALGFADGNESEGGPRVPFSLERLTLGRSSRLPVWARLTAHGEVRGSAAFVFDLDLFDEQGEACVHLHAMGSRVMPRAAAPTAESRLALLAPTTRAWVATENGLPPEAQRIYLGPGSEAHAEALVARFPLAQCVKLEATGEAGSLAERYRAAAQVLREDLAQGVVDGRRTLLQLVVVDGESGGLFAGLFGQLRSFSREQAYCPVQLITLSAGDDPGPLLDAGRAAGSELVLSLEAGQLRQAAWQVLPEVELDRPAQPWRAGGVYLLSGALGALGRQVALDIAGSVGDVTLLLLGRGAADAATAEHIQQLQALGARAFYRQVDLSAEADLNALVRDWSAQVGPLTGVLHLAGTRQDGLLRQKTAQQLDQVLQPKVAGTWNLDLATAGQPLEFFLTFASIAGALGNAGQSDYACANGFMDAFVRYRNHQVRQGLRQGRSLSIDWPLWRDGAMQLTPERIAAMTQASGLLPLDSARGLQVLRQAIVQGGEQWLVLAGQGERFGALLGELQALPTKAPAPAPKPTAAGPDWLKLLRDRVGQILKVDPADIDDATLFPDMGFDSVMLTELVSALNLEHGLDLAVGQLFEYSSLEALAAYLGNAAPTLAEPRSGLTGADVEATAAGAGPAAGRLMAEITDMVCRLLKTSADDIDPRTDLHDFGFDSVLLAQLLSEVNAAYGLELSAAQIFETPSLEQLVASVGGQLGAVAPAEDRVTLPVPLAEPPRALTVSAPPPLESLALPQVVLLSAGSDEQLRRVASNLLQRIETPQGERLDLRTLAQVCQASSGLMDVRLGLVASDLEELAGGLRGYLSNDQQATGARLGVASLSGSVLNRVMALPGLAGEVAGWLREGAVEPLLQLWSQGLEIDWQVLSAAPGKPSGRDPLPRLERPWSSVAADEATALTLLNSVVGEPLYCFPAAGAGAHSFLPLAAALDGVAAIQVLEYPPLDPRVDPAQALQRLVAAHVQALLRRRSGAVLRLLGHSFGASIAFEVARQLRIHGRQVELYMLDSFFYVPQGQQGEDFSLDQLTYFLGDTPLRSRLLAVQGERCAVSFSQMQVAMRDLLPTQTAANGPGDWLAAQVAMSVAYRPSGRFDGETWVIVPAQSILGAANLPRTLERYCAYLASGPQVATVTGGHMSMLNKDHVQSLVRVLQQRFDALPLRHAAVGNV